MIDALQVPLDPNVTLVEASPKGMVLKALGRSIVFRSASGLHRKLVADGHLPDYLNAVQVLMEEIQGLPPVQEAQILDFTDEAPTDFSDEFVYKFVTLDAWDKYYSKGIVRLSPLAFYRSCESQEPGHDTMEGAAHILFEMPDMFFHDYVISGFNSLIFCSSSRIVDFEHMKAKFGSVVVRIKVDPFKKFLIRTFKGFNLEVRKVAYGGPKYVLEKSNNPDLMSDHIAIPSVYRFNRCEYLARKPSIFGKSLDFANECEVRFALQGLTDIDRPKAIRDPFFFEWLDKVD